MMTFVTYKPLQPGEMRLLDLGAAPSSPILVHADINVSSGKRYLALSYCWGTENCLHKFELQGQTLVVPSSLFTILKELQEMAVDEMLWADAICINQDDQSEKAVQIPLMDKIYANASTVIGWLGTPTDFNHYFSFRDDIERVFNSITEYERPQGGDILDAITDLNLPPIESEIWTIIAEVFTSRWFERVWILQEAALARKLRLCFGPFQWRYRHFRNFVGAFKQLSPGVLLKPDRPWLCRSENPITQLPYQLCWIRERCLSGSTQPLGRVNLVELIRARQSTNASDKIWGLYGLANFQEILPVNLKATAERVFIRAAKALLASDPAGLSLLELAGTEPKSTSLPSWVPDLRAYDEVPSFDDSANSGNQAGMSLTRFAQVKIDMTDDNDSLGLQGFVVDNIDQIETADGEAYQGKEDTSLLLWIDRCESRARKALPHFCSIYDLRRALYRALVADRPNHYVDSRQQFRDVDIDKIDSIKQEYTRNVSEDRSWDVSGESGIFTTLLAHKKHHSFFTTHNGRLGLGPKTASPGDAIWIVLGASAPYVCRPVPKGPAHVSHLLGQAYLDGVMDGEAMRHHEHLARSDQALILI